MCIFCGGQCGGLGDFLISIGLPFLGLYLLKMKSSLARIKNKIFRISANTEETQKATVQCECCAESGGDCGKVSNYAVDPQGLELFELKWQDSVPAKVNNNIITLKKERLKGVRGWLLLLCLNLSLFIPASYLYQASCDLNLILYQPRPLLLMSSWHYDIFLLVTMILLAIFSFYAGYRLWNTRPKAVKIAKVFLVFQLSLTSLFYVIRLFMPFRLGGNENIFRDLINFLIPSLLNFILWYLYLSKSIRVQNTYDQAAGNPSAITTFPVKVHDHAGLT